MPVLEIAELQRHSIVEDYSSPELPLPFFACNNQPNINGLAANQPLYDALPVSNTHRHAIALIDLLQYPLQADNLQLALPLLFKTHQFLRDDIIQFHDYLPKARLSLMRKSLWSFVARTPQLHRFATTLESQGINLIGDAIQLTREELLQQAGVATKEVDRFESLLADAELHLGKRIANWSSIRFGLTR